MKNEKNTFTVYLDIEEPVYQVENVGIDAFNSRELKKKDFDVFEMLYADDEHVTYGYLKKDRRLTCPTCEEKTLCVTHEGCEQQENVRKKWYDYVYTLKCQCDFEKELRTSRTVYFYDEYVGAETVCEYLTDEDLRELLQGGN